MNVSRHEREWRERNFRRKNNSSARLRNGYRSLESRFLGKFIEYHALEHDLLRLLVDKSPLVEARVESRMVSTFLIKTRASTDDGKRYDNIERLYDKSKVNTIVCFESTIVYRKV